MTMMPNVIAFRPYQANQSARPLRRPRVLIRAAREGQAGWRRERDLKRLLKCDDCPAPGAALPRLRAEEAALNQARLEGAAAYDLHRHVMLVIAIMAETRAAIEAAPQPVMLAAVAGARAGMRRAISRGTASPAHP